MLWNLSYANHKFCVYKADIQTPSNTEAQKVEPF